jgi:hypothetical protein
MNLGKIGASKCFFDLLCKFTPCGGGKQAPEKRHLSGVKKAL